MNIIGWIVVGLIAGAIAKMLVPGNDPGGIIMTMLIGIAGAIVGGFISIALGLGNGIDNFDIGRFVLAVLRSVILLLGYRMVAGERSRV